MWNVRVVMVGWVVFFCLIYVVKWLVVRLDRCIFSSVVSGFGIVIFILV